MTTILKSSSEKFNIKDLETKSTLLLKRTEEMLQKHIVQERSMSHFYTEIKKNMSSQNAVIEQALTTRQRDLDVLMQNQEERDQVLRTSFDSLFKNQTNIVSSFQNRMEETDQRVMEVLNVILGLQTAADKRKEKEDILLQNLDESLIDKIERVLDDHESNIKRANLLGGMLLAVITPVAIVALGKMWQG